MRRICPVHLGWTSNCSKWTQGDAHAAKLTSCHRDIKHLAKHNEHLHNRLHHIVSLCPDRDLEEKDQAGHGPEMFQKFNILMPLQVQGSFTPFAMLGYGGITLGVGGRVDAGSTMICNCKCSDNLPLIVVTITSGLVMRKSCRMI